ncbi:hypothetical protein JAAARDRAFT_646797 [Jaapia argillacea MUCL 33604]|uniref:Uncharacterized protein n=1 Tax=Jaapia argillacea MUCL 33604 TaxID=933084 RepID=A0A067Q8J2_9AGAM|nr:hypothetical protein JAAARDRAFT_646797 [Jaapia argillacea MUCL 33604]
MPPITNSTENVSPFECRQNWVVHPSRSRIGSSYLSRPCSTGCNPYSWRISPHSQHLRLVSFLHSSTVFNLSTSPPTPPHTQFTVKYRSRNLDPVAAPVETRTKIPSLPLHPRYCHPQTT